MAKGRFDHILAMLRRGRFTEARTTLERISAAESRDTRARALIASTFLLLGDAAFGRGQLSEAIAAYDDCLRISPRSFQALYDKGVVLYKAGQAEEAATCYLQALAIEPKFAPAHSGLGVIQAEGGDYSAAIESHRQALTLSPDNAEFHNNLGLALDGGERLAEAVESFDAALRLDPTLGTAWLNRGVALHRLWRLGEALASIDHALAFDDKDAEAWSNRGLVLNDLGRGEEALSADEQATSLQPGHIKLWANKAATCNQLRQYEAAAAAYERALAIDPDSLELRGNLLHTRMLMCDWSGFNESLEAIQRAIVGGAGVLQPFVLLPTPVSPEVQRTASERLVKRRHPSLSSGYLPPARDGRIRLGYVSADFRQHAMMFLMGEVFEHHDRRRFETIALSIGPPSSDAMRARAEQAFERFIDVSGMSDEQVTKLGRELGLDIAVDLGGFTRNSRPGIFARRVAPVQVNYLGYPGTLGANYIDYLIADEVVVPERLRGNYVEKIATMPHCYMGNPSWQPTQASAMDRRTAGLPEAGFVFCCFNNNYKITPDVFDVWMRLLDQVPGSVLWLLEGHSAARENLRREAVARGISADRLVFAGRLAREDHLRRHALADLFLDTLHYGAHTTASDALRTGLPVLTRLGETFTSRVAASLVFTIGMPEMVTVDLPAYEALALALARDPDRLSELRRRTLQNAASSPLFDVAQFARDMEGLYVNMHARARAGHGPEHMSPGPQSQS